MTRDEERKTEFRFLLATLVVLAFLSFLVVRFFLYYVVFGILLVFSFYPLHRKIRKWVKSPAFAATLSLLVVILAVVGPLVMVGFMVFRDAVTFAQNYDPEHLNETIQPIVARFGFGEPVIGDNHSRPSAVANWMGAKLRDLAQELGEGIVGALPGLVIGMFIAGFVAFYGFVDGETFYLQLRHTLPLPDEIEDALFHQIRDVTRAVFLGTILIAVLSAALGTLTFLVFGIPNAIFWGFIMVILGVLPIVGAPFVWLPVGAWLLLDGHAFRGSAVLIINLILGFGYIEHVLRPKIIGRMGRVHPVWVLVGVLGGVEAFGILGFVIGPLVLACFVAILRSYTEFHPRWVARKRKGAEPYFPRGQLRPQPFRTPPERERRRPSKTRRA